MDKTGKGGVGILQQRFWRVCGEECNEIKRDNRIIAIEGNTMELIPTEVTFPSGYKATNIRDLIHGMRRSQNYNPGLFTTRKINERHRATIPKNKREAAVAFEIRQIHIYKYL